MKCKEFFKPTIIKSILLIIFLLLTILIPKTVTICSPTPHSEGVAVCGKTSTGIKGVGYPIFFGTEASGDALDYGFDLVNFLINIITFYLISCLIFYGYKKIISFKTHKSL